MNGLHQQLAAKRSDLKANEAKARSTSADPRDASDAKERLPFLKQEIEWLEGQIAISEMGLHLLDRALSNLRILDPAREANLCINAAEVSVFRLKNHLGQPS